VLVLWNEQALGIDLFGHPEIWAKMPEKVLGSYLLTTQWVEVSGVSLSPKASWQTIGETPVETTPAPVRPWRSPPPRRKRGWFRPRPPRPLAPFVRYTTPRRRIKAIAFVLASLMPVLRFPALARKCLTTSVREALDASHLRRCLKSCTRWPALGDLYPPATPSTWPPPSPDPPPEEGGHFAASPRRWPALGDLHLPATRGKVQRCPRPISGAQIRSCSKAPGRGGTSAKHPTFQAVP